MGSKEPNSRYFPSDSSENCTVLLCTIPMIVMPGDDPPHPRVIGEEIAELAPNNEVSREWKGSDYLQTAIDRVTQFLDRHTSQ